MLTARELVLTLTAISVATSRPTFAFVIAAFCDVAALRSSASVILSALAIAPVLGSATTSINVSPFVVLEGTLHRVHPWARTPRTKSGAELGRRPSNGAPAVPRRQIT